MWAIMGQVTRDLLTYRGRPVVHDNRDELQWLLPGAVLVRVSDQDLRARSPLPPLPLRDHPDMAGAAWPLDREEFR